MSVYWLPAGFLLVHNNPVQPAAFVSVIISTHSTQLSSFSRHCFSVTKITTKIEIKCTNQKMSGSGFYLILVLILQFYYKNSEEIKLYTLEIVIITSISSIQSCLMACGGFLLHYIWGVGCQAYPSNLPV